MTRKKQSDNREAREDDGLSRVVAGDDAQGVSAVKSSRRGGKSDVTRRLLLDAALSVIGEKGYTTATVDQIVEAAGVSKGVAYYHFKSKASMAASILEEGIGELVEEFEAVVEASPHAAEALNGMITCFAARIFDNEAFGRFLVSELWRENRVWSGAMRGYEHRLLHLIESQVARGKAEGVIRDEIDPAFEAVALVGMVLTTALYYLTDDLSGSVLSGGYANRDTDASSSETHVRAVLPLPENSCTFETTFALSDQQLAREAFIQRICDFVRHANVRPELLG